MSSEVYLESVRRYAREREKTDYIMPIWLPFIPVIIWIVSFVGMIAVYTLVAPTPGGMFTATPEYSPEEMLGMPGVFLAAYASIFVLLGILGLIVNVYVLYKWIDRRNKHFRRVRLLLNEAISYLRSLGGDNYKVESYLSGAERTLRDAEYEESEKSAAVWIVLSILVPFLIFYVYHFLNKDFYKHERHEDHIIEDLNRAIQEIGGEPVRVRRIQAIPDRSTVVYIVLTIVTMGLFGLYWVYTLTKDPNQHFMEHRRWEDDLLRSFEKLLEKGEKSS